MNAAAREEMELRRKSANNDRFTAMIRIWIVFFSLEIHDEMFSIEVEIFKTRSRIKQWMKYRDVTQHAERRAIEALERELAYMIDNYVVLSSKIFSKDNLFNNDAIWKWSVFRLNFAEHLEKSTQDEQKALTQMAEEKIAQKTRAATERVAMGLDGFTRKMLSENQYMVHEVINSVCQFIWEIRSKTKKLSFQIEMRERELVELEENVRSLEKINLDITDKLNAADITNNAAFT